MTAGVAGLVPVLAEVPDCGCFVDSGCSWTRSLSVTGGVCKVSAAAAGGAGNNW